MKKIIIGGTNSGCGKTTVTCAVLSALCRRGLNVASFKCGPDYIDPMFHSKVIGTSTHNLDSFFCDDDTIIRLLCGNGRNSDISVIEGVMGYYDDVNGRGSAYSIAKITDTPAVIVINCKGMSGSLGAVMKGFLEYRSDSHVAGFIFDRLPERLSPLARELCNELGTEYLGFLPASDVTVESRHLGLVTADEIADIREKLCILGELAEKYIDIDRLMSISEGTEPCFAAADYENKATDDKPIIAVARDEAFCFIYADNILLLEKLGCSIVYFSPLHDERLPEADGLILSGGYPELHAGELAGNHSMKKSIYSAINSGMPVIAECGGFMYLNGEMTVGDNEKYTMVGVFDNSVHSTDRLQRFGYITMTAHEDNLLCRKGGKLRAHEFHYWDSTDCGSSFTAEKSDGRSWDCGFASETMYAGFPHFYFYSDVSMAERFVRKCSEYGGKIEKNRTDKSLR